MAKKLSQVLEEEDKTMKLKKEIDRQVRNYNAGFDKPSYDIINEDDDRDTVELKLLDFLKSKNELTCFADLLEESNRMLISTYDENGNKVSVSLVAGEGLYSQIKESVEEAISDATLIVNNLMKYLVSL